MSTPAAKPSSDLATRFAAAVVMIAVACAAIYFGGWPFRLLVAAAAAIMMVEWGDMHRASRQWSWIGAALLAIGLVAVSEWLYPAGEIDFIDGAEAISLDSFDQLWTGLGILGGLALLFGLLTRRLAMGWGFLYIALPSFALIVLEWARFDIVFWAMLVTWSTDIFAYFAGRSIGGPKLAPRISPNKTWAGLIGGMAGAGVIGAIAAFLFDLGPVFLLAGAPLGLLAQLGDLYESSVKRRLGVKDSGSLLPGHGGILDRVDGLLPVTLATLGLLLLILGTA
ncbi:phosphatidate cytidylyltransferase [Sphingosinicella sp. BN140058]|uniref:phosphatidate cytidylyltransferase n=1 Tax=Sphingosinicella sp. BN140058 TaxID=1892855 RepID=UPI0010137DEB|nr:phosphatidate cytidylyltransferase [Sphingosinicella sp. BN140058]QAY79391.1 phosphatidate cytidylyltransferase [Sphingosinicella sp. BN140058]